MADMVEEDFAVAQYNPAAPWTPTTSDRVTDVRRGIAGIINSKTNRINGVDLAQHIPWSGAQLYEMPTEAIISFLELLEMPNWLSGPVASEIAVRMKLEKMKYDQKIAIIQDKLDLGRQHAQAAENMRLHEDLRTRDAFVAANARHEMAEARQEAARARREDAWNRQDNVRQWFRVAPFLAAAIPVTLVYGYSCGQGNMTMLSDVRAMVGATALILAGVWVFTNAREDMMQNQRLH